VLRLEAREVSRAGSLAEARQTGITLGEAQSIVSEKKDKSKLARAYAVKPPRGRGRLGELGAARLPAFVTAGRLTLSIVTCATN
jgi:hypothetical protein